MISVCMATYNGARFIREQIDSILPQLNAGDELIISDDGSTDGTVEILKEYASKDSRVKLLWHEKTGNKYYPTLKLCYSTKNFENALNHAKGDFIFLADQDDVWENDKVSESSRLMERCDFVLHNFSVIDSEGNITKEKYYQSTPLHFQVLKDIVRPHFWGCCSCFKRNILEKALPIPEKVPQHDIWIGLVAEKYGKCIWLDKALIRHRIYDGNTSTGGRKSKNSLSLKLRYRLNTLIALSKLK